MKALFIPFAPSLAHVSRCLAVAEAWQARGHTALFAVGAEREALVQAAGFDTRPLPEVSGEVFRTAGIDWMTAAYFSENLAADRAVISETAPDVVVSDFRFTTSLAARLAGIRSVSILHGSALCFAFLPALETGRLLVGDVRQLRGVKAVRARFLQQFFPIVFRLFMRSVTRRWAPVLRSYGCPPADSPYALILGDETFAADLPEMLPSRLPPCTHVTGPLLWSGWEKPAPWLDELDSRPLVYVTMGSTVEAQTILVKIIDALRDRPYNVVVSTGNLSLPNDLNLPAHIRLFPTVPGATVLQRSKAIVHLGGHGTLMQALAAGVPSLLLPANPDQVLVAQKAQAMGIATSLWQPGELAINDNWQRSVTLSDIRNAVDRLMSEDSYRTACQSFKRKLSQQQGAAVAAEMLEEITQTRAQNGR